MIIFILLFFIGNLFLQILPVLPNYHELEILILINLLIFLIFKKYFKYIIYFIPLVLGFLWAAFYANYLLSWSLPKAWEGKYLIAKGVIASLPVKNDWQTSFLFSIYKLKNGSNIYQKKTLVRLVIVKNNKNNLSFKPGQEWILPVKLKRIHSTQNEGAIDFEKWALQHGIRASGVVINHSIQPILVSHHWYHYAIEQFRYLIHQKILNYLPNTQRSAWLMTLITGEHSGVPSKDWDILRLTGTNHLMAIAGLHMGMLIEWSYLLIVWLIKRTPKLLLYFPANIIGISLSLLLALAYSTLAGFSIPTERALMMYFIVVIVMCLRKKVMPWTVWSLALLLVLIMNPLSVLSESFYLSFGTIAIIIYGMSGRMAANGFWWKWFRVQWVISVGLIPLSLFIFQECSLISFIANSIAIPWLSFLILPFCFLSMIFLFISPTLTKFFLYIANTSLEQLWKILTWFSQLSISSWHIAIPNYFILFLSILGILILLMPRGLTGRMYGVIFLLPLFFYPTITPSSRQYWVTLLDVGQGLSVIVQTKSHLLIYDAGPKYHDFDLGKNVVLPYLYKKNIKKIDMLVISHGDNDHIGGAFSVEAALPILEIKTSVPEKFNKQASLCLMGQSWEWDQVHFSFIYPDKEDINLNFNNDNSCVLLIDNGDDRTLLTGDIEKYAEEKLIKTKFSSLPAYLLIAPHHGSKTSGLKEFIAAVHPQYVLYATGYRNRYHFPHPSVVKTYSDFHIKQLNTAETGMITFKMNHTKEGSFPSLYRLANKKYWFDE